MNVEKLRTAFEDLPADNGFYSEIDRWTAVYEGHPAWQTVKKAGLQANKGGTRQLNSLNVGKVLCDELAHRVFAEQCEITAGREDYDEYLREFLDREGFWRQMPRLLARAFAEGGMVIREYIDGGKVRLDYVEGRSFYPTQWTGKDITGGIFVTQSAKGGFYYTLFERHSFEDGVSRISHRLFRSGTKDNLGEEVPVDLLYEFDTAPETSVPQFQYYAPNIANNRDTALPLGISCFANALDTLRSIDIAFDSLVREFILGRKRIIVPSSCIRTVVDPDTGKVEKYFDSDDEVYQALKCDDDKDLKIQDNTMTLRIEEHSQGISTLLNILCFQCGLSAGTLAFDAHSGVKTATEIVSEENKTAVTMRNYKNLLAETIQQTCTAVLELAMATGEISTGDFDIVIGFKDNIIIDDNQLIENNINLVNAGLKSKVSAVMDVLKCDEETARKELERVAEEAAPVPLM